MDAWQQSVENRLTGLENQVLDMTGELRAFRSEVGSWFRWLIGLLVVLFGSMLAVMAKGFGWV